MRLGPVPKGPIQISRNPNYRPQRNPWLYLAIIGASRYFLSFPLLLYVFLDPILKPFLSRAAPSPPGNKLETYPNRKKFQCQLTRANSHPTINLTMSYQNRSREFYS